MFDAIVASRLRYTSCDAVVAYESCASLTFRAAKRLGMACILDAANLHHRFQDQWVDGANTARTIAQKDYEIEMAELIITCSSLARDSYIAAGVPSEKVSSVPLGVDLSLFRGDAEAFNPPTDRTGPIVFCNAGLLDRRKGIDLILSACRSLRASGHQFKFVIAGNKGEMEAGLVHKLMEVALIRDRMPQPELPKFYGTADVFVLPSRFDSFGMVVLEALACGLPVIVSDCVGAKDVVQEGVNGWVIPAGESQALAERMAWCSDNASAVRGMRRAARASVLTRGWANYRQDVAELIRNCLEVRRVAE